MWSAFSPSHRLAVDYSNSYEQMRKAPRIQVGQSADDFVRKSDHQCMQKMKCSARVKIFEFRRYLTLALWSTILYIYIFHRATAFSFSTTLSRKTPQLCSSDLSSLSILYSTTDEQTTDSKQQSSSTSADVVLWKELCNRFQGDFDNYQQVLSDREQGLLPKEGGGHEHIHCTLIPVSPTARLAAFYFDGAPKAIFRFRYYKLIPRPSKRADGSLSDEITAVDTRLYTLHPALEGQLRQVADQPTKWPRIFREFQPPNEDQAKGEITKDNEDDVRIRLLPRCDVRWSFDRDPVLHAYAVQAEDEQPTIENDVTPTKSSTTTTITGPGIHAVMVHGEALVDSQMIPGQQILIKDQLSLWEDALWIHDRGFHPDTGDYIYGNQRNIPYQLQRVSRVIQDDAAMGTDEEDFQHLRRKIVSNDLAWTLGEDYRTPPLYQTKIDAMGGPSIPKRN